MKKQQFKYSLEEEVILPKTRPCEKHGCEAEGEYRAPKNPHSLKDYFWFCLEHIREYNKSWDFYKGMSSDEIEQSRMSDITWNRPSWPVGGWRSVLENAEYLDSLDPFLKARTQSPALPAHVKKALTILDVAPPITMETLKKSYKRLAKANHPDLNPGDKLAEERLKIINAAYQTVKKFLNF